MFSTSREIEDGDIVIIWQTREAIQPLLITAGSELQSKFGYYRHSDLIGLPYGSKVGSRNGKGFIHVLRPTPELWTMALPHRTQILYLADIALITSYLHVTRGSIVIEAGTGSGSFTHSLARTVGSVGKVLSYEFHEQRADKAREEFNQHGMADIVTLTHRNVCKDGFTVEDEADAVFLDLPAPWDAVEHAKKALRKNVPSRICCFSPCMEQVIRTVNALNEAGFTDITMYETLSRPMDIQQVPDPLPLSTLVQRLKSSEKRREDKRQRQIASSRARYEPQKGKRKREDGSATTQGTANSVSAQEPSEGKRIKMDGEDSAMDVDVTEQKFSGTVHEEVHEDFEEREKSPTTFSNVGKIFGEVRGHTSYLTFACLVPSVTTALAGVPTDSPSQTPNATQTH